MQPQDLYLSTEMEEGTHRARCACHDSQAVAIQGCSGCLQAGEYKDFTTTACIKLQLACQYFRTHEFNKCRNHQVVSAYGMWRHQSEQQ